MKIKNKIELTLENFEKSHLICDVDCPLGELYDYSCALLSFILQKMKEANEVQQPQKQPDIQPEAIGV